MENEQPVEEPAAGARTLLVWRQDLTVYHRPLEPLEKVALTRARDGAPLRRRLRSVRRVDVGGRGGAGGVPAACALGGGRYHRATVIALLLGRFHALTRGQAELVASLAQEVNLERIVCVVTSADHSGTRRNPLDAETREAMLRPAAGGDGQAFDVVRVNDIPDDAGLGRARARRRARAGRRRAAAGGDDADERQPRGAALFAAAGFTVAAPAPGGARRS